MECTVRNFWEGCILSAHPLVVLIAVLVGVSMGVAVFTGLGYFMAMIIGLIKDWWRG